MANPVLAERVRSALATLAPVEERKMFGGIGFMVDGKLCVSVGAHRLMCRIDPATHEKALEHEGAQTVTMNGRQYKGYVHVAKKRWRTTPTFTAGSGWRSTTTREPSVRRGALPIERGRAAAPPAIEIHHAT